MADLLIGSEAIANGELTRGQLRWNYRTILPDVYIGKTLLPLPEHYVLGAWLWSRRRGVIAGATAATLHGAKSLDDSKPVEMIWRCGRPPPEIVVRNERIQCDEIVDVNGLPVTTPERTAVDLARNLSRDEAVCHLDALARATGLSTSDVWPLLDRYAGARGVRQAVVALSLMDGGASSARESQLRLALIDSGFAVPRTGIKVTDGDATAIIAMGYEDSKVGVVCDDSPPEIAERMGWSIVQAATWHTTHFIVYRVRNEVIRRGYMIGRLHTLR